MLWAAVNSGTLVIGSENMKQNDWKKATEAIENLAILVNGGDEDINETFQSLLETIRRRGSREHEGVWRSINFFVKFDLGLRLPPRGKESKVHLPGKVERRGCPDVPCSESRPHCSNCGLHGVQYSIHEGDPDCFPRIYNEEE